MPKDFLILQVRVAVTVERKVEKYLNCASAHVYHAELKAFLHMIVYIMNATVYVTVLLTIIFGDLNMAEVK